MLDVDRSAVIERPPIDWLALIAIGATIAGHLILQRSGPSFVFIASACLFWTGYVAYRGNRDPGIFRRWGFRRDNLVVASRVPLLMFATGASGLAIYGALSGQFQFPPSIWLLLLVYPIWGIVQQFLTLGIFLQSLEQMIGSRFTLPIALSSAALFSAVHTPDLEVMAATFALELLLIPLFLRYRNLWPLGIVHGFLGALFYTWGLGRNMVEDGLLRQF